MGRINTQLILHRSPSLPCVLKLTVFSLKTPFDLHVWLDPRERWGVMLRVFLCLGLKIGHNCTKLELNDSHI